MQPQAPHPDPLSTPFALSPGVPVDSHYHIFEAHQSVPGARYRPAYTASLSDWTAAAAACGVGRGVLVQPSFLGTDNRLMLGALQRHPALRGVVVVAPHTPHESLQAMQRDGVRGIRLNLVGSNHDVTDWCHAPALWAAMMAMGWHLQLHTDAGALPAVLKQLLPALPEDLPLVLDHFAKPLAASPQDETVRALKRLQQRGRQVHVKLSGTYRLGGVAPKAMAAVLLQTLGPDALLWGSDWPCTNHEPLARYGALHQTLVDTLENPVLITAVLTDNPHRLYA